MKKSLTIVIALILLLAFCLPLSAAFATNDSIDAEKCDRCFEGTVRWKDRRVTAEKPVSCTHGLGGSDYKVYVYPEYICSNCGYVYMTDPMWIDYVHINK